jgi:hypothetical protein
MYLMDATRQSVNNRKWNLGRMGLQPVYLRGSSSDQAWRLRGMRGLGRLGQATDAGYCTYFQSDGVTPENVDLSTTTAECAANGGQWTAALNVPAAVGKQNPSPVAGGASNGGRSTVMATTPSQNPLDYTSPQAAIAAGLDPTTVYNAWSKSLARFPSPQAAIAAGVPAGVVNQLWQQSNVAAANAAAASASSFPWGFVAIGAAGLLLLPALSGRRRR